MARQTLEIEAAALNEVRGQIGEAFARAVEHILCSTGRVVVMGMGKSGHVGRKLAATLASTGTPALFVHPAEASHGDLGMVLPGDTVVALSNSGESDELAAILPALKRLRVVVVAITGRSESTLARHADIVLLNKVSQEACPLNLAPTASTTAQLALGDALAVALLDARGFREEDFARSHPGGALGRRLLLRVRDVMRGGDAVPRVSPQAGFVDTMREMSAKGLGATAIVDPDGRAIGIFTDGDLRRALEAGVNLLPLAAEAFMRPAPRQIRDEALAAEAASVMEDARVSALLVSDADGRLVGAVNTHDLMRAKVI